MKQTFSIGGSIPAVTELLPHHDLVFRAPVCDPTYGLPLGNGDTGVLLWLDEDTLHIQLNHTDCVDDLDTRTDARALENGLSLNPMIAGCFKHVFFDTDADKLMLSIKDYLSKYEL